MDLNTEFAHLKTLSLKLRRGEGHLRWSRIFVSWILFSLFTRSRVASPAQFFGSGCSSVYTRNKGTRWVQVGRNLLSPVTAVILAVGGFSFFLDISSPCSRTAVQRQRCANGGLRYCYCSRCNGWRGSRFNWWSFRDAIVTRVVYYVS